MLQIADGQYQVWDCESDITPPTPGGANGLVGTAAGLAIVITGTQFGPIGLDVEFHDGAPPLDVQGWDEVVEVSLTSATGELVITSDGRDVSGPAAGSPSRPSDHRVRVHARGRDAGSAADVVEADPVEHHLVQVWPAPSAATVIHRVTDRVGARLRDAGADTGAWNGPGGPPDAILPVGRRITATDLVTAELGTIEVYPAGCLLTILVKANLAGLSDRQRGQSRRAVEGHARSRLPGVPPPGGPVRVVLRFPGGAVDSAEPDAEFVRGRRPLGPVLFPQRMSYPQDVDHHAAELGFWVWPSPPPGRWDLTLEWPSLGIAPATIPLDGSAVRSGSG